MELDQACPSLPSWHRSSRSSLDSLRERQSDTSGSAEHQQRTPGTGGRQFDCTYRMLLAQLAADLGDAGGVQTRSLDRKLDRPARWNCSADRSGVAPAARSGSRTHRLRIGSLPSGGQFVMRFCPANVRAGLSRMGRRRGGARRASRSRAVVGRPSTARTERLATSSAGSCYVSLRDQRDRLAIAFTAV